MVFKFSGTLLRFTNYEQEFSCNETTLEKAIQALLATYPDLKNALLDRVGKFRATQRFFCNEKAINLRTDLGHELKPEDCVSIITQISGG